MAIKKRFCKYCNQDFTPTASGQVYCSLFCKKAAARAREVGSRGKLTEIAEMNKKALESGMSYGRYVAMVERPNKIKRKGTE